MTPTRKNLCVFGHGLAVILTLATVRWGVKGGWGPGPAVALVLAVVLAGVTARDPFAMAKIYKNWMKVAGVLGTIISTVVLTILFYLVFGLAGCCLRLLRRDPLARAWDRGRVSYWIRREARPFNREDFLRQF